MKKLTKVLILVIVAVMLFGTVYSSAAEPYDTYTYSIDGEPLTSPHAYSAIDSYDAIGMNLSKTSVSSLSSSVSDIVTDSAANVYIADKGNHRILVLNKSYEVVAEISKYIDENGKERKLSEPQGVYVTDENKTVDKTSYIYVCDTGNKQIVVFDREYNYVRTIVRPDSPVLDEQAFKPCSIAVDIYGRIFVISTSSYEGVIVLSNEGDFTGFIGSQKVSYSLIDMIWRRFMTKEQRQAQEKNIAVPYNNITVDDDGFVYVTTNTTDSDDMANQFTSIKSKSSAYSPVKKLNSQGVEIMKRNGFFDPGGEVAVTTKTISQIVDVAMGNEGSWTIVDKSRSRFFTYDQNGNLLFAFGDKGDQLGNGTENGIVAICYQIVEDTEEIENGTGDGVDYRLIALDQKAGRITVYEPTDYCDTIMDALHNENIHNYSESQRYWEEVLTLNNNFDLAYIGIGKALYNLGKYEEAQEMLASAYETEQYSKAFAEIRKQIINDWLLLIAIAVVAVLVLFVKFLGYAKKKNKATSLKVGKKTYWEELIYSFHLVFHPFDGFWDLKHEKRGSVRAATTIIALTMVSFFYQSVGRGYTFNPRDDSSNIFMSVLLIGLPLMLWCIANWCLTTLFDGEGSFKDIYIAAGYSLAPLPLFVIISTILTNILTVSEGSIVTLILTIGYIWVGLLLYFGMMVTHDYSLKKNFVTILGTILAMIIIMFIAILFFSLIAKIISFVVAIFTEIGNRV